MNENPNVRTEKLTVEQLLILDDSEIKDLNSIKFDEGLKLLEELVGKVESGKMSLEDSVTAYEKGVVIFEKLKNQLSGAEEKLKVLQRGDKSV